MSALQPVVPFREKVGYSTFFVGQNILFMAVTMFLAVFYTGSLGIPATVVGTIFLIARVWDALVDPVMAAMVEKINLRGGKFKPWVLGSAIAVPLLTISCFGFESTLAAQDLTLRVIYASATYLLWGTAFAAADAPAYALATVMTPSPSERNVILTANQFLGMVGLLIAIVAVPQLLAATNNNWFLTSVIFSAMAMATMLTVGTAKERVTTDRTNPPTVRSILGTVLTNKYLLLTVGMLLLSAGLNFSLALAPYVAGDIFGDATLSSVILASALLPSIVVVPFIPILVRRFWKTRLLVASFFATAVLSVLIWLLARDNFGLLVGLSIAKGIVAAPLMVMVSLLFADSIEYDFFRTGKRFEAATFAARTMSTKAASAVAGGLGLFIIGLAGYQETTAGETPVQPAAALDAMWGAFNRGTAVGAVLAAVLVMAYYDLTEERLAEIVSANLERETVEVQ